MDPETLHKLLLNSNYYETLRLCKLNKNCKNVCGNQFWKEKYEYKELPTIPNVKNWFAQYTHYINSLVIANNIFILADSQFIHPYISTISITFHDEDLTVHLPDELSQMINNILKKYKYDMFSLTFRKSGSKNDYAYDKSKYDLDIFIYDNNGDRLYGDQLTRINNNNFTDIITHLIYFYPKLIIMDEFGVPYYMSNMNKSYNYVKDPWFMDNEYDGGKLIKDRIDFWKVLNVTC